MRTSASLCVRPVRYWCHPVVDRSITLTSYAYLAHACLCKSVQKMCLNMHPGLQIVRVKKEREKKKKKRSVKANIAKLQKEQDTHSNTHSHLAVFISSEACCVNYMVPERELEYTQHF